MNIYDNPNRIIRMKELLTMIGLSKATIYNLMAANEFPKPIKLTKSSIGWRQSDIIEFLNSREIVS